MTAVTGRHQARLHDITRPIRSTTLRRLRAAAPKRRRLDRYDVLALVLLLVGAALVLLLPFVGRWVG